MEKSLILPLNIMFNVHPILSIQMTKVLRNIRCHFWLYLVGTSINIKARRYGSTDQSTMKVLPKTFLWGVSTSSYQVEGDIANNDWDFFTRSQQINKRISTISKPSIFYKGGTQVDLQSAGDAAKFWDDKYYTRDFDLARSLGLNAFRISIEWTRIEPEKDHWDQVAIDHYKAMLVAMRERNLVPVVSLNHATLPLWVMTPPQQFLRRVGQNLSATSHKGTSTRRALAVRSLLEIS